MKILITLFIFFFSFSLNAEYRVFGNEKCGTILKYDRENNKMLKQKVSAWIQGYFTGRNYENMSGIQKGANIDYDTAYFAAIKYCQDNPLDHNAFAAEQIYEDSESY